MTITVTTTSSHAKAANGFSMICRKNREKLNPYSVNHSINCENGNAAPIRVSNAYVVFIIISEPVD
mgnify:CR=1 FL=1